MTVKMVDLSDRDTMERQAIAKGRIHLKEKTVEAVKEGTVDKGDVLAAAQIAGVHGVKSTCTLIPMCHSIPLTYTDVKFNFKRDSIQAVCEVRASYKTGVEMEALLGVTTALLTIWDMVKYLEKDEAGNYDDTRITDLMIQYKVMGGE